ncbi:uncharacterized protein LACBIDRAFT_297673 [Laccaria bicolor S238N-H82]|nr:uncharacterized protein LACBIDRAFT_297673 [Laccaria bicolor S238N-H82]EDR08046.1 predicted protein [Laccaria bicolor S238N-H82]|eukprot:XP_001881116.1 predicted protein [Laccaria bicolor S238N-H82]
MIRVHTMIEIRLIAACHQVDLGTTCLGQLGTSWQPSLHKSSIFSIFLPGHIYRCSCSYLVHNTRGK